MKGIARFAGAALVLGAVALGVTGCETGRGNKRHGPADVMSDETTTGRQDATLAGNSEGQPPVPGSPTAAGADGKQPYNDYLARSGPGAEHGTAPPPAEQVKDSFERQ